MVGVHMGKKERWNILIILLIVVTGLALYWGLTRGEISVVLKDEVDPASNLLTKITVDKGQVVFFQNDETKSYYIATLKGGMLKHELIEVALLLENPEDLIKQEMVWVNFSGKEDVMDHGIAGMLFHENADKLMLKDMSTGQIYTTNVIEKNGSYFWVVDFNQEDITDYEITVYNKEEELLFYWRKENE